MTDPNLEVWREWIEGELKELRDGIFWVNAQLDGASGDDQVAAARGKVPTLLRGIDELLRELKDRTKLQPPKKPVRW